MSEIKIIAELLFENKKDLSDLEYFNCMKMLQKLFNKEEKGGQPREKESQEIDCPFCGEVYNPEYYPTYN
tara:strand:- start:407 stop:616 length:210 start_codon:yes stop_codon:yes gene_type:complete